ncbi:9559_t:CDS:2 [Funneliformis geosporum]|uniref:9559_t:CDS:1 n=1 Tax=Funneliformis geosporum TaxID=1117311 RepID=A0A9W4WLL6_9GLOM|nr:9559_t:CDS:2 [Funneliformis geosporum]
MSNKFEYYGHVENLTGADVIIQAGEHYNFKKFLAHSEVLKDKSPYFRVALSSTWAKREDEKIILKKPNVSPTIFCIILEYFYTGNLPLDQHDGLTIIDLLIASDELLIVHDLLGHIQDHLINVKTEWLKENFSTVLHVVFEREACKDLQNYCMDKICWNPKIIFDSVDFLEFEEYILVALLKHDNLQIEEIELWDYLIKWGISQLRQQKEYLIEDLKVDLDENSPPLNDINDLSNWDKRDLQDLGEILKDCIPLIRFSEFSIGEFYDKIWPLKDILPSELKQDISLFQKNLEIFPKSILSPRKPIISINSVIIKPKQASKIPDWIDQVQLNSQINSAIYDDPSFGPCFGKTDLDMRRQFNEENCSAKKRCYKHTITNTSKFAVDDYEVFQVLCHTPLKNLNNLCSSPKSDLLLAGIPNQSPNESGIPQQHDTEFVNQQHTNHS